MASSQVVNTNIRLLFEVGQDPSGEPIFKARNYNNVKTSATNDQIYQAAQAIASLTNYPLFTIERVNIEEVYG